MLCSALSKPVNAQVCLWNLRTGAQRRVISAAVAGGSSRDPSAPRALLALGDDAVAATCGREARCTYLIICPVTVQQLRCHKLF